jgi:phosphoglycerate kinase
MSQSIRQLDENVNVQGKKVFLRAELNVPITNDGHIGDDFRIKKMMPTLEWLQSRGAQVIIGAHLWGDDKASDHTSLKVVHEYFLEKQKIEFATDLQSAREKVSMMKDGEVLLLENLRYHAGEQENSQEFAKKLADLADMYVNEAFPVSHRQHASIVGIPKFIPGYAGLQFMKEYKHLSSAFNPPEPFLFILGGAKFETKLPVIQKFIHNAEHVFVAGALMIAFYKAQGMNVGDSLVPKEDVDLFDLFDNPKLILPTDVVVLRKGETVVTSPDALKDGDVIHDIGPDSMERLEELVDEAAFILWNGPLGDYKQGSGDTTYELARILAASEAETVIGGGDTVAAIQNLGNEDQFTFVSSAGGAMLDFLDQETLPGIEALKNSPIE